jgi:hypothetical protein
MDLGRALVELGQARVVRQRPHRTATNRGQRLVEPFQGRPSPDAWKPPRRAAWCLYARWWIDVKSTWKLTITTAEHDALAAMLTTC